MKGEYDKVSYGARLGDCGLDCCGAG